MLGVTIGSGFGAGITGGCRWYTGAGTTGTEGCYRWLWSRIAGGTTGAAGEVFVLLGF